MPAGAGTIARSPEPGVFSLAVSAAGGAIYAGSEPSRLFRSDDQGESWRELAGLLELPSRPTWSFPPRPWTSHVRWIAPSPHDAELILVGIELGGLMRSTDGGQTWHDHRPGAQRDVHSLAWHPQAATTRVRGRRRRLGVERRRGRHAGTRPTTAATATTRGRSLSIPMTRSAGTSPRAPARSPRTAAAIRRRASTAGATASRGKRSPAASRAAAGDAVRARRDEQAASSRPSPTGSCGRATIRGDTWRACTLRGDKLPALNALAFTADSSEFVPGRL